MFSLGFDASRLPRSLALLAAACLTSAALCGCRPHEPADVRTVRVDGRQVAYRVLGHGRPVLVMISGLGDSMASFSDVAPELAKNATVIVYDRAGYGGSDAASGPRDAAAADRELSGLLQASGVAGPYVVAGHSLGGLYAEYFAAHHPSQVSGLILEESRTADFGARCQAAKAGLCGPPPLLVAFMPKGARQEFDALDQTAADVGVTAHTPVPVLVLSRPISRNASRFDAVWGKTQQDLAVRYAASHLTAPAGGHNIHRDQPGWFVAQVRTFLAGAS